MRTFGLEQALVFLLKIAFGLEQALVFAPRRPCVANGDNDRDAERDG